MRKIIHVTHGDSEIFNIFRGHITHFKGGFIHHYLLKKKSFLKPYSFPFLLTMHHISFFLCLFSLLPFFLTLCWCPYILLLLICSSATKDLPMDYIFLAENTQLAKRRCIPLVFSWLDLCVLCDMEIKGRKYFLKPQKCMLVLLKM